MPPKRKRPCTPPLPSFDGRVPGTEYDTPRKAGLHSIWAWEEYNGRKPDNDAIFQFLDIRRRQGYEILKADSVRTLASRLEENPRGAKRKCPPEKAKEIGEMLDNEHDAQYMTWGQLGMEVGIEATERTIRVAAKHERIIDGIAIQKPLVSHRDTEKRIERAKRQLETHGNWEDWKNVLFSDEVHFGWSDEGKIHIKRRVGTAHAPEHIHHPREPRDKDRKRFHCWALVGWNFKSPIYFYDSGNSNGKMTHKAYIEQILEPIIKPLLEAGKDFVLFEDGDSGHGTGKNNIVCKWKEDHGLKHYFNVSNSPDLNIIENCWSIPKHYTRQFPHWNDEETKALIIEGWEQVSQKTINKMVKTYPQRLKDVIKAGGQLTGW